MEEQVTALKNALVITLGCRLNLADTALLTDRLERAGYRVACREPEDGTEDDNASSPDLVLLNSCAVTFEAERKTRQTLRRLRRTYPAARIGVLGCCVTASGTCALKQDGADFACANPGKKRIEELIAGAVPELDAGDGNFFHENACARFVGRTRGFIKIQEGCDNRCSYCLIPDMRGASRSRDWEEILREAKTCIASGYREITLTGVNICDFRTADGRTLYDLCGAIADIPGDFRIRLGSTEPAIGRNNLVKILRDLPKMCRFLHLSLQHGSNAVLSRMRRHYTAEEYGDFALEAKSQIDGLHLGTDFIVGFPQESDAEFQEALELVERIEFANIHVFPFSPRPGTPAAEMPGRPAAEKVREREKQLKILAEQQKTEFRASQRGKILPVIFETVKNGIASGWSDNYLRVSVPADTVALGEITGVRLT